MKILPMAKHTLYRVECGEWSVELRKYNSTLHSSLSTLFTGVRSTDKIDKLAEILKATDTKTEYDIVGDLEQLQRLYGVIKAKDYRKKLAALIEKYKTTEITEIRSALLKKCLAGDVNAIRLYCDCFKQSEAVAADDGLVEALMTKSKDVFKDEN